MAHVIDAVLMLRDQFSGTMKKASEQISEFSRQNIRLGKQIEKTGKGLEKFGGTLTKAVTLPLVGLGAAAAKLSMDFGDSMAKVSTIADTSQKPIAELKREIIDLSNKTGIAATELAAAEYEALSAGVETAKSTQFLGVAVKAAKGGFTDTTTAIKGLTDILNAYGKGAEQAGALANQMLIAQNLGKTTFGQMATSMGKVTPIAAALGLKTEELFSSMAVTTAQGLATAEAVTGLKAALSNIIKPTKSAQDAAEAMGLEFNAAALKSKGWMGFLQDVKARLSQAAPAYANAADRVASLNAKLSMAESAKHKDSAAIKALRTQLKGAQADLKALEAANSGQLAAFAQMFGSIEGLNTVLMLTSENGIRLYNEAMRQMKTNAGALDAAYQAMQTPGERLRQSFNKLRNAGILMGDSLTPAIDKISDVIGRLAERVSQLSPAQMDMIVKIGMLAAAIGPTLSIVGKLTSTIGTGIRMWGEFGKAVKKSGGILQALFTPGNTIVLVIMGIAIAAYLLYKNWDKIVAVVKKVGGAFTSLKNGSLAVVRSAIDKVREGFDKFRDVLSANEGKIKAIAGVLGVIFGPALIQTGVQASIAGGKIAASFVSNLAKTGLAAIKTGAQMRVNLVGSMIKTGAQAVATGAKMSVNLIKHIVLAGASAVKTGAQITSRLVVALAQYAAQGWKAVASIARTTAAWVAQKAAMLGGIIATKAMALAQGALNLVLSANPIGIVVIAIAGLVAGLVALYKRSETVRKVVDSLWNGLKSGAKSAVNVVIGAVNAIIRGLNRIHIKAPDWLPLVGGKEIGFNIPEIPKLAQGARYFKGGLALVGERGPELVTLPRGARIWTAAQTARMMPPTPVTQIIRQEIVRPGTIRETLTRETTIIRTDPARRQPAQLHLHLNIDRLADRIDASKPEDVDKLVDKVAARVEDVLVAAAQNMGFEPVLAR